MMKSEKLEFIVPIGMERSPEMDLASERETMISRLKTIHKEYGFNKFMLAWPSKGWRSSGLPPEEYYRERAEFFRDVRAGVAGDGIVCGWWNLLTLKSGPDPRWHRMVRANGTPAPMANCPLDPVFRETYSRCSALFVKIAKPAFMILEDDFSMAAGGGCFCEQHLAEFARRTGQFRTREEVAELLGKSGDDVKELKIQWGHLMRDSLALFADDLRQAVDEVDPALPIGAMQSGGWDVDGSATEKVTKTLAGDHTTPFIRLYGTYYGGERIWEIPDTLFHPLWFKQHLPENFTCLHESDTFPSTRFYTSAACMRVMMSSVYSFGFDGSTFQAVSNPSEKEYGKFFRKELPRLEAIHTAAKKCRMKGVQIVFDPEWSVYESRSFPQWITGLSRSGIPYTSLDEDVAALSAAQAACLSDASIRKFLAKGLLLDGEAADELCRRGYGEYLGVTMRKNPVEGIQAFDLGGCEAVEEGFLPDLTDRRMPRFDTYSPGGNGNFFEPVPSDPACEVVTRICRFPKTPLAAGMTRFVNKLGGRIAVMGMGVYGNQSASLLNYCRQRLFQDTVLWCGGQVVFVKNEPRVFVIMNEAEKPAEAGFFGMLTLTNLNPDPLESVSLHLPEAWRNVRTIRLLDPDGEWQTQTFTHTQDGAELPVALDYAKPQVLLFEA